MSVASFALDRMCAPTRAADAAALPPEQLCWLSRGDCMKTLVPRLTGARHRIENAKQLVRAGGERDLLRFARRNQAVVEGLDHRVEAHRTERGHVQRATHNAAATPDMTLATLLAGIVIQWRQAGQLGRACSTDRSQLRHEGQNRCARGHAKTLDGVEALRLLS